MSDIYITISPFLLTLSPEFTYCSNCEYLKLNKQLTRFFGSTYECSLKNKLLIFGELGCLKGKKLI